MAKEGYIIYGGSDPMTIKEASELFDVDEGELRIEYEDGMFTVWYTGVGEVGLNAY